MNNAHYSIEDKTCKNNDNTHTNNTVGCIVAAGCFVFYWVGLCVAKLV